MGAFSPSVSAGLAHQGTENIPFPSHSNDNPTIPVLVFLFVNLGGKCNGTHDSIPELLIQDGLVGIPIILYNLIESVDQRFLGRHLHDMPPGRIARQLLRQARMVYF